MAALRRLDRDAWGLLGVGICARDAELEITVRSAAGDAWAADALEERLAAEFGPALYSRDGATLDEVVARGLLGAGQTVAVAESCTGGGLGARLTARSGSSAYVLGGVISYADEVKRDVLGVDAEALRRHGAVSAPVAEQMAAGVRSLVGSDWALSVTGIAGPGGGSPEKPVGLVYVGVAGPGGVSAREHRLRGDRERIRRARRPSPSTPCGGSSTRGRRCDGPRHAPVRRPCEIARDPRGAPELGSAPMGPS